MTNIINLNGIDYIEIPAKTNDKICKDCEYFLNNGKCTLNECPCKNDDGILTMATIKSYTDLHQSKILAEKLPLESADMFFQLGEDKYADSIKVPLTKKHWKQMMPDITPCWSLAALLKIIPDVVVSKMKENSNTWEVASWNGIDFNQILSVDEFDNHIDACVAMIEKLHELKML